MKKILNITSSVKGPASQSIQLANAIIDKLTATYPDSQVITHNLAKQPLPHLDESHVTAFYTPAEARTAANKAALIHSDEAIKALMDADIIVIGVPIYNFNIPSTLKAWIDHIVRAGITFSYTDGVPKGFVTW